MPKVSIITAVFNGEKYITETIESVLFQTFTDWEYIIVDDGSTDDTKKIVSNYLNDKRIIYFYQENQKQIKARNNAYRICRGNYVAFIDQDDIWEKTKLEKQFRLIDENPDMGLCYTAIQKIDTAGSNLKTKATKDITKNPLTHQIIRNSVAFSSLLVRKSAIEGELLNEKFLYTGDGYLTVEIAKKGWSFGFVNERLLRYRVHDQALSRSKKIGKLAFEEKKLMIDQLSIELDNNQKYKSILSKAYALSYLGYACNLIRYGDKNDQKLAKKNIILAIKCSINLSILLRCFKWWLLSIK